MKLGMKIKQLLIALLGNCILGFGVGMIGSACLGADPSISFSQAASIKLGITLGQMITITNCALLLIVLIVKRKNIGIATLIVVLLNQYPVDFISSIIPQTDSIIIKILWILLGILCVSVGCNVVAASNLGMGIYDAFTFGIADRFNIKYLIVRYVSDTIFLILTILLDGYVGIGTILSYLLLGILIRKIRPYIFKAFHFE